MPACIIFLYLDIETLKLLLYQMQIQRQRFGFIPMTVQQDHIAMFNMTIVTQSTVLSSSHTTK